MEHAAGLQIAGAALEISVIDLMLSADNALVIAMCCAALPAAHARTVVILGTAGAIALRGLLTAIVGTLLLIPWLKIVAAVVLVAVAVRLVVARDDSHGADASQVRSSITAASSVDGASTAIWSAIATFIAADAIMSLDNIVALGAIAQGDVRLLMFGLLLSIPLLVFGGLLVVGLLKRYPILVELGGVVLGWIAGEIAVTDPTIAIWVERQAPALAIALPFLGVALVWWESRIIRSALRRRAARAVSTGLSAASPRDAPPMPKPSRTPTTVRTE